MSRFVTSLVCAFAAVLSPALAHAETYSFNVLNHRSVALTLQYWNPILTYVREKTGVTLELKLNKTAQENTAKAETGVYDFLYTNHFFTPERERLGYRVIARPAGPGIRSEIVVNADSPIRDLHELEGKEVVFPTPDGFTGYWLPMDALLNAGVHVKPVISGNQEASIGRLRQGEVHAAGVNSSVLENFARRTHYSYRILWSSPLYNDLAVMASPRVPKATVAAVRSAFVGMAKDPKGREILAAGADLLKTGEPTGFVAADNRDYDNYRAFYRQTRVK
ncbi:MAG TPA: phosphate/phosphite/phosphonate ABC transporter substrate-binding protein [Burkholderiales bacterium]|nr:phosphate/phosphite/phosphonate ABC transporter substrate-binding protein [Burkholderiales bacterium]